MNKITIDKPLRGIDLFCGAGCFGLAQKRCGIELVLAVNHWDKAVEVHAKNNPGTEHMKRDLTKFRRGGFKREFPQFDILTAGPSCQGHSDAGQVNRSSSQKVFDSHAQMRATAWAVHECMKQCRPRYAVIENVLGFSRWSDLNAWLDALRALGYAVTAQRLLASKFGNAQRRWRWIFICVLGGPEVHVANPDVPEPGVDTIYDADCDDWINIEDMRGNFGVTAKGHYTAKEKARISNERLGGKLGWLQHTNYGKWGIPASEPVNTVTATPGQLCWTHEGKYRQWSDLEWRRVFGFGDNYDLCGANKDESARLFGNAIPLGLGIAAISAAIGRQIHAN